MNSSSSGMMTLSSPTTTGGTTNVSNMISQETSVSIPTTISLSNQQTSTASEGIFVAIRMRPPKAGESQLNQAFFCHENMVLQGKPEMSLANCEKFQYDRVFDQESKTSEVYKDVGKSIVAGVMAGINGTIFAYGQTSSGKTHTMLGSSAAPLSTDSNTNGAMSTPGVIDMAAADVFAYIREHPERDFVLRASFVEIYMENIRDLLGDKSGVSIREDPRRGVYCEATEWEVNNHEDIVQLLRKGISKRVVEATAMNDTSSRSHTIFKLVVESKLKAVNEDTDGAVLVSALNLVDLAGSESVKHTGASGQRAKEGASINRSLLTLSLVINALATPGAHVKYRDSKLTRLLQPSLSGNAKVSIVCCVTASAHFLEETRSTLQFASRAKLVVTHAKVNEVVDDTVQIRRLRREVEELKGHLRTALAGGQVVLNTTTPVASTGRSALELARLTAAESELAALRDLIGNEEAFIAAGGNLCAAWEATIADSQTERDDLVARFESDRVAADNYQLSLTTTIDTLRAENRSLAAQLDAAVSMAAKDRQAVAALELQLEEVKRRESECLDEVFSLTERLANAQSQSSELENTRKMLSTAEGKIMALESSQAMSKRELDALRDEFSAHLSAQLNKAADEMATLSREHQIVLENLNKESLQVSEAKKHMFELTAALEAAEQRCIAMSEDLAATIAHSAEELSAALKTAAERESALHEELDNVRKEADKSLTLSMERLEALRDEFSITLSTESASAASSEMEMIALRNRLTSTETAMSAAHEELANVNNELASAVAAVEELLAGEERSSQTITALRSELSTTQSNLVAVTEAANTAQLEINRLETALEKAEAASAGTQAELHTVNRLLELAAEHRSGLESDLESALTQVSALTTALEEAEALNVDGVDVSKLRNELLVTATVADESKRRLVEVEAALVEARGALVIAEEEILSYGATLTERNHRLTTLVESEASAKAAIALLRAELDSALATKTSLNTELVDTQDKLKKSQDELVSMQSKLEMSHVDLDTIKSKFETSSGALATVQAELEVVRLAEKEMTAEITMLRAALEGAQSDLKASTSRIEALESELVDRLAAQHAELSEALAKQIAETTASREAHEEASAALLAQQAEIASIRQSLIDQTAEAADAKARLEAQTADATREHALLMRAADVQLDALRADLTTARATADHLTARLAEAQIAEQNSRVEVLRQNAEHEATISKLREEIETLKSNSSSTKSSEEAAAVAAAELENAKLRQSLATFRVEYQALDNEFAQLARLQDGLHAELRTLRDESAAKDARIAHLDACKLTKDQLARIQAIKDDRKRCQEDARALKKQLVALKNAYDELKAAKATPLQPIVVSANGTGPQAEFVVADLKFQVAELTESLEASRGVSELLKSKLKECAATLAEYERERAALLGVLEGYGVDTSAVANPAAGDVSLGSVGGASGSETSVAGAELSEVVDRFIARLSSQQRSSATGIVQDRLVASQLELDEARVQRIALEKKNDALKQALRGLRDEHARLQGETTTLRDTITRLESSIGESATTEPGASSSAASALQVLEEENIELIRENKDLRHNIANLKSQIAALQTGSTPSTSTSVQMGFGTIPVEVANRIDVGTPNRRRFGTELDVNTLSAAPSGPPSATKKQSLKRAMDAADEDLNGSGSTKKRVRAKPLTAIAPDESTGECAQS